MAAGKQLHGNLTPAHADGCAAQCFEGVQRGSLIILSVHPRHRLPHLFRGLVLSLTCLVVVPSCGLETRSWRTDRMARHKQECIRLPYTAALASQRAFFVKVGSVPGIGKRGKGKPIAFCQG